MKRWGMAVVVSAALLVTVGCSGSGSSGSVRNVTILAESMSYNPKEFTLTKGEAVKLTFTNKDSQLHDFSIEKIAVKAKSTHNDGHDAGGKNPDLHLSADASKSGTLEFTPTEPGTYTYFCTVAGHKEAGMSGRLIVK